jgi:hypothetical protein
MLYSSLWGFFILILFHLAKAEIATWLHLTDLHIDLLYNIGTPNNCWLASTGTGCCRNDSIPLKPYTSAGKWGDIQCDANLLAIENTFLWINNNLQKPQHIKITGDLEGHADIDQIFNNLGMREIQTVTELVSRYFNKTKIYWSLGNHDTRIIDQLQCQFNKSEIGQNIINWWKPFLSETAMITFKDYGYYKEEIGKIGNRKIYLISLNSLAFDKNNLLCHEPYNTAEINQLDWLEETLNYINQTNGLVEIMGHIPPGSGTDYFTNRFNDLVIRFYNVILNSYWGHKHYQYFILFVDKMENVISTGFLENIVMIQKLLKL